MHGQQTEQRNDAGRGHGFAIGFLTGTFVGAGLALWFSPRLAAELRQRVTDSANDLRQRATETYEQVSTRIATAADDVTHKTQEVRANVADVVARGAHEVERLAKASKTR